MITGDYHHTAIAVASNVGMIQPEGQVVVIDSVAQAWSASKAASLSSKVTQLAGAAVPSRVRPCLKHHDPTPADDADDSVQSSDQLHVTQLPVSSQSSKQMSRVHFLYAEEEHRQHQHDEHEHTQCYDRYAQHVAGAIMPPHLMPSGLSGHAVAPAESPGRALPRCSGPHVQQPCMVVAPAAPVLHTLQGFTFLARSGDTLQPSQALSALAEGRMQCAVTGDALEHLLQLPDLSVLETVLRSAVVFSRMQPHQKGQVMELLGLNGLHQLYKGQPRFIPVCNNTSSCLDIHACVCVHAHVCACVCL